MKAKALAMLGICLLSACEKEAEKPTEAASLRSQQSARERVEKAARDYLEAVNSAAMARRGAGVQRKLIETSSRLPLGAPAWADTQDTDRKSVEAAAHAAQAKVAFYQALAAYRAAAPNTPPLPDYPAKIAAHETELAAGLELMESGREDVAERWYGLIHKTLEEVTKSES